MVRQLRLPAPVSSLRPRSKGGNTSSLTYAVLAPPPQLFQHLHETSQTRVQGYVHQSPSHLLRQLSVPHSSHLHRREYRQLRPRRRVPRPDPGRPPRRSLKIHHTPPATRRCLEPRPGHAPLLFAMFVAVKIRQLPVNFHVLHTPDSLSTRPSSPIPGRVRMVHVYPIGRSFIHQALHLHADPGISPHQCQRSPLHQPPVNVVAQFPGEVHESVRLPHLCLSASVGKKENDFKRVEIRRGKRPLFIRVYIT